MSYPQFFAAVIRLLASQRNYSTPSPSISLFYPISSSYFFPWLLLLLLSFSYHSVSEVHTSRITHCDKIESLHQANNFLKFVVIFEFMGTLESSLKDQLTPAVETQSTGAAPSHYTHRSIETLVVVLAVITIIGVIAGIIARLCGGRHFGANGENDIEGWVERKCRSCIDGGVPAATTPAPPPPEESKPATEQTKK